MIDIVVGQNNIINLLVFIGEFQLSAKMSDNNNIAFIPEAELDPSKYIGTVVRFVLPQNTTEGWNVRDLKWYIRSFEFVGVCMLILIILHQF